MHKDLIGKEVTAVATNGIGTNKEVQGVLGKFSYPCADIADSYYVVLNPNTLQERHIEVLEHTIQLLSEPIAVNEHFLCFNEMEAAILKEIAALAIPSWNVGVYLNYLTHEMGDEGVVFMQKLDFISKEVK